MNVFGRALAVVMALAFFLSGAAPAAASVLDTNRANAEAEFYDKMQPMIKGIYRVSQPNDFDDNELLAVLFSDNQLEGRGDVNSQVRPSVVGGETYHVYAEVFAGGKVLATVYEQSDDHVSAAARGQVTTWEFDPTESVPTQSASPTASSAVPVPDRLNESQVQEYLKQHESGSDFPYDVPDMTSDDGTFRYTFTPIEYIDEMRTFVFLVQVYDQDGNLLNEGDEGNWVYGYVIPEFQAQPTSPATPTPTSPSATQSPTRTASPTPTPTRSATPTTSSTPTTSETASATPAATETSQSPSPTSSSESDLLNVELGGDGTGGDTPWWRQPVWLVIAIIVGIAATTIVVVSIVNHMEKIRDKQEMIEDGEPFSPFGHYASPVGSATDRIPTAPTPSEPKVTIWEDDNDPRQQ